MQHITEAAELKKVVTTKTGLIVIKASAAWCGPCQRAAPVVEGFARKYPTTTFLHLDVDDGKDLARELKVTAMPTFIFIKGGKEIDRIQGADLDGVEQRIKQHGAASFEGAGHRLGDTAAKPASASSTITAVAAAASGATRDAVPERELAEWPLTVNEGEAASKFLLQHADGIRMPYKIAPARHKVSDVYAAVGVTLGHKQFALSIREGMKTVELEKADARTCAEAKVAGGTLLLKLF